MTNKKLIKFEIPENQMGIIVPDIEGLGLGDLPFVEKEWVFIGRSCIVTQKEADDNGWKTNGLLAHGYSDKVYAIVPEGEMGLVAYVDTFAELKQLISLIGGITLYKDDYNDGLYFIEY